MSDPMNLFLRYTSNTVIILENDDGKLYKVIEWTEEDKKSNPNLVDTIDEMRQMVQNSPQGLIQKLYGSVENWDEEKQLHSFLGE